MSSYGDDAQGTPLADEDRESARTHLATAIRELNELAKLVGKTLGRSPDDDRTLTRFVIDANTPRGPSTGIDAADEPVDVGVHTFCAGHECLGVYDAFKGICRPCTPDDHACD